MREPDKNYKPDWQYPRLKRRIRESGHWTWVYIYDFHGRTRFYTIGRIKLTEARKIAAELNYLISRGQDPQSEKLAERNAGTFGELYARYVNEHAKRENKSWEQADYLVRVHLLPRWARLAAKSITRADVRVAIGRIDSKSVARQVLAAASAVFSFGVEQEVIAFNPCSGIKRTKTKSRKRVLSDSELALFWPDLTLPLRVVLLTGQRPGEVEHLLHLHIRDGWWEMPGEADPKTRWPGTKNGEFHRVWLVEAVREIIAASPGDSGFVFKRAHLDAVMRAVCAKLGVEDKVTPHDLRRTWTTIAASLGVDHKTLDRVLNHADRSVTHKHYNQYTYAREDAAVMERVARHIIDVAEKRQVAGAVVPFTKERR